ncbi:hypothetical protein [Pseudoalteromonas mariniglutinosa]|uniref:hypothetical protein n=1 Tax=Pseudoalteromonas mariniglutinosa TaxID=206042 RepID=UPI00384AD2E6
MTYIASSSQPQHCCVEHALSPWQTAISQGNSAFECGELLKARDNYTVAHQLAANLVTQFSSQPITPVVLSALSHCCPALVIAVHNLADTYKVMTKPSLACRWLCKVHQAMAQLLNHTDVRVQRIVVHHHYKTYYELVKFAQQYNHQSELIDSINDVLKPSPTMSKFLH